MIDLTKKPFSLSEKQCERVYNTLASMTLEEKVGQTFCAVSTAISNDEMLKAYDRIPFGGMMYRRPGDLDKTKERTDFMQCRVKIPLLIPANLEMGGSGVVNGGTIFGCQMQVAATNDPKNAFHLGDICGIEAAAVGVNWAFAPVVDIDMNWRNPITNTRTYGNDPEKVMTFGSEYMHGIMQHNIAVSIKHFPGDGVDERDQHLVTSVNSLSCEEWDNTYGRVYGALIEQGAQTVMVGHILQPAYIRYYNPDIKDEDMMPATISPEIIKGLLRGKLNFNGVIITDAADMTGLSCAKPRRDVPAAIINAGVDMILFGRNLEEDYNNMLEDARKGVISEERLNEAVTRILALKASLGLNEKRKFTDDNYKEIIGCERHLKLAEKCADEAVTLVKDTQKLLPVSPETHKRVWLNILGDDLGFRGGIKCKDMVIEELERAGFDVTYYDESTRDPFYFEPVEELKEKYDVIMYFANVINASNRTVTRLAWSPSISSNTPQYVKDIPTLFVSLGNPYHFVDVPMIRTIINCYTNSRIVIRKVIEKITGKSEFKGVSPVDPFCGMWGKDI